MEFVNDTEADLRRRFDSLLSHPLLQATRAFDHSRWPSSEQTKLVDTFGNDDIDYLLNHYEALLMELDVDAKLAVEQWIALKREVTRDPVKAGIGESGLSPGLCRPCSRIPSRSDLSAFTMTCINTCY